MTIAQRKTHRRGRRPDPTLDDNPFVSLYIRRDTKHRLAQLKAESAIRTGKPTTYDDLFLMLLNQVSQPDKS